jgi:hypothetical protein
MQLEFAALVLRLSVAGIGVLHAFSCTSRTGICAVLRGSYSAVLNCRAAGSLRPSIGMPRRLNGEAET